MAILSLAGVKASDPFCDALDLTFPADRSDEVKSALLPFLIDAGGKAVVDGLWEIPRHVGTVEDLQTSGISSKQRTPTVKMQRMGQVYRVSLSGGVCDTLRKTSLFAPLLANLWPIPHRVTRLDATIDVRVDAPEHVAAVASVARSGGVALGRKAIKPKEVLTYTSLDVRGVLTGTVYVGGKSREIRMRVYDKRHESEERGALDPGPWLRAELQLRDVGATLRDAIDPAALFWNYASAVIVPPVGVTAWSAGDTGYALPPPSEPDYWRLLKRKVDDWRDLREVGELSRRLGPYGPRMLLGLIAQALGLPALPSTYTQGPLGA